MLIGISGKAQSGKDTVGKIIQNLFTGENWEIKKFADKVKTICSILTGIPVTELEKESVKNSYLPEEWGEEFLATPESVEWGIRSMTVRQMLQKIGTDCMRNNLHYNTWVNAIFVDYKQYVFYEAELLAGASILNSNWIITDVRFPNEVHAIKQRGGKIIRIQRNRYRCQNCSSLVVGRFNCQNCGTDQLIDEPYSNHESETALDKYRNWDHIIYNNGTLEELTEKVTYIFNKFNNEN